MRSAYTPKVALSEKALNLISRIEDRFFKFKQEYVFHPGKQLWVIPACNRWKYSNHTWYTYGAGGRQAHPTALDEYETAVVIAYKEAQRNMEMFALQAEVTAAAEMAGGRFDASVYDGFRRNPGGELIYFLVNPYYAYARLHDAVADEHKLLAREMVVMRKNAVDPAPRPPMGPVEGRPRSSRPVRRFPASRAAYENALMAREDRRPYLPRPRQLVPTRRALLGVLKRRKRAAPVVAGARVAGSRRMERFPYVRGRREKADPWVRGGNYLFDGAPWAAGAYESNDPRKKWKRHFAEVKRRQDVMGHLRSTAVPYTSRGRQTTLADAYARRTREPVYASDVPTQLDNDDDVVMGFDAEPESALVEYPRFVIGRGSVGHERATVYERRHEERERDVRSEARNQVARRLRGSREEAFRRYRARDAPLMLEDGSSGAFEVDEDGAEAHMMALEPPPPMENDVAAEQYPGGVRARRSTGAEGGWYDEDNHLRKSKYAAVELDID